MRSYYRERERQKNASGVGVLDILRANKRMLIILGVIVVALIVIISVGVYAANRQAVDSSTLLTRDVIRIGLRTDVEGFGQVEEDGSISGLDKDVISEALRRIVVGQPKIFEYSPLSSQDAGASIKYGDTDINLGMLVADSDRTKGFSMSKPYYTDQVVALVRGSSRLDRITNMEGGKLGYLSAMLNSDDILEYLDKNKMTFDLLRYSDYESAMADIDNNRVNAVLMPMAVARKFEPLGFRILAEPVYEVGYSIMLPTTETALTSEIDRVLVEMKSDGTLDALREKWQV